VGVFAVSGGGVLFYALNGGVDSKIDEGNKGPV
jgi:hypothetical protein